RDGQPARHRLLIGGGPCGANDKELASIRTGLSNGMREVDNGDTSDQRRKRMKHRWVVGIVVLACLIVAGGAAARTELGTSTKATKVTLQLKWVTQAQFAGYYAAKAKGYYSQAGLDVNLKVGGPTITPEQVVLGKQAEFGIDWVPSMLSFRD